MFESKSHALLEYVDVNGKSSVGRWLSSLDLMVASRVRARLNRIARGNFGDCKSLGESLFEVRFDFGSGYRIYFAIFDENRVLLLCGGDKKSQRSDILTARKFWVDFKRRTYGKNKNTKSV